MTIVDLSNLLCNNNKIGEKSHKFDLIVFNNKQIVATRKFTFEY